METTVYVQEIKRNTQKKSYFVFNYNVTIECEITSL